MKFKEDTKKHWRKPRGFKLLTDVIDGLKFVSGEKQETETWIRKKEDQPDFKYQI